MSQRDAYQVTLTVYARARKWPELKRRISSALGSIGCDVDFVHYEIDTGPRKHPEYAELLRKVVK